jgi:uncharacterized protein
MNKIFLFLLIIIFAFGFLILIHHKPVSQLKVGNSILQIEIADTEAKREQGLSDRKNLCSDCGLLFVFNEPNIYPFWMRRMYFDIDILWIRNGEVVDITYGAKVPPKEELEAPKTTYQSKVPVNMVLEVNSGWVREKGIKVGDKIKQLD